MKLNLLIIFTLLTLQNCLKQSDKKLIVNWYKYPIPTNPDTIKKYNFSPNEWHVYKKNDSAYVVDEKGSPPIQLPFKVKVKKADRSVFLGRPSIMKVDDGYLVGFYRGEWGGALYWVSKDGKKYYKISDHEIVQFINKDGKLYAIEGLAHLNMSEGSIIKIYKSNNVWMVKDYLKLSTAPEAVAIDDHNNFIIITSKSLLKVDNNAKTSTLINKGIWWYAALNTNSLIIKNNIVYAGMRAGVCEYDLNAEKEYWLLPY
ncbi:hypothetical protein JN11_03638 [Mucilaginibacter frigoritolerans]|uniref:WG repeat protein n=1 Tax=Mucilaginibacter frigoritolerans TaxID=652788 RepID=A0A562TV91_9SPHI|nr:hypothetical protein [Mucilaginibacter frigoritolerans]TWI97178.1 hypothetical protein JN11_03638 [Mucilaginibacter frigoritolerans]